MATSWITGMVTNAIAPTVHSSVSQAGGIAGDLICGVGNSINGVGSSIDGYVRSYGNGVNTYGNAVKDWTKAEGPRVGTSTNPLGLQDTWTGGKHVLGYGTGAKKEPAKKPPQKAIGAPPKSTGPIKANTSSARAAPSVPKKETPLAARKEPQHATKPSDVNSGAMMNKRADAMRRKKALEKSAAKK